MPNIILAFLHLVILSFNHSAPSTEDQKMYQFEWLEGTWERTDTKEGFKAYEIWTRENDLLISGDGFSLKGTDTSFYEKLKIEIIRGEAYYIADVPENEGEIAFQIMHVDMTGFRAQNLSHDFPQQITYLHQKNQLDVTLSGNGKSGQFQFRKVRN